MRDDAARPGGEPPARSAVVLAGGVSRRFGRDKRAEPVDGVAMLARVVAAVGALSDDVVVVTRPDRPLPASVPLPGSVRIVHDAPEGDGPLAGLAAGLAAARHPTVLVAAGDHPWLVPATLEAAGQRLDADPALDAVVADDGRPQPLVGCYRRHVGDVALAQLRDGERRVTALLDRLRVVCAADLPHGDRSARDVDAPQDLVRRVAHVEVVRHAAGGAGPAPDRVVVEEPLAIRLAGTDGVEHEVSTTLRTPGHEAELAVGFLLSEGLLDLDEPVRCTAGDLLRDARPDDHVTVHVDRAVDPSTLTHRHVTATASCGLCGRATIDDLLARVRPAPSGPRLPWSLVAALPDALRAAQAAFAATGGLHATGIAGGDGRLQVVREDVGRHNALDAAIGRLRLDGDLPLGDRVVVLSGRVGFELVQKVAVAGGTVVVAVGAPSDLAVRAARDVGLTLVGFVRDGHGNVYTRSERIDVDP